MHSGDLRAVLVVDFRIIQQVSLSLPRVLAQHLLS